MEQLIGNYRIIEKLGEGGMGEVFRALDVMLEREVAIKLLRAELSSRPDVVERFRTEAIALARLNHPHIATLYSFSRHENQYYMVLEFVRGETLDMVVERRGAMSWQEALRLICQALHGLEHAHRLGIIHRDIKPSNMMLNHAGDLKLMDFGIARILERSRLTQTGHLIGTLEYMSPEQIQGKETDGRSDIYSIGIVLYKMLTKRLPFEKSTDYDLIRSQVEEAPPPLGKFMPDILRPIEDAVLRALAKAPELRFHSAAEFRVTLEKIMESQWTAGAVAPRRSACPETRIGTPAVGLPELAGSLAAASTAQWQIVRSVEAAQHPAADAVERWKSRGSALIKTAWRDYPIAVVFSVLLLVAGGTFTFKGWLGPGPLSDRSDRRVELNPVPTDATSESAVGALSDADSERPIDRALEAPQRPFGDAQNPPSPENPFQRQAPSPLEIPSPAQGSLSEMEQPDAEQAPPVKPAPAKRSKSIKKRQRPVKQNSEDREFWKDKSREVEEFLRE